MENNTERQEYVARLTANIPKELASMQRFCFALFDKTSENPRKHDKLPARVERVKGKISKIVPGPGVEHGQDSFLTLKEACEVFLNPKQVKKLSGIGFYFLEGDGLTGLDFDELLGNPEQSQFLSIIREFPKTAYVELSKNGDGLHIIGKSSQSFTQGSKKGSCFEVYSKGRYFLLTGKSFENFQCNGTLPDITDLLSKALSLQADAEKLNRNKPTRNPDVVYPYIGQILSVLNPNCTDKEWVDYGISLGNFFKNTKYSNAVKDAFTRWSQKSTNPKHLNSWHESEIRINDFFRASREAKNKDIGSILFAARAKGFDTTQLDKDSLNALLPDDSIKLDDFVDLSQIGIPPVELPETCKASVPEINYKAHPVQVAVKFASSADGKISIKLIDKDWWHYNEATSYWAKVGNVATIDRIIEKFIIDNKYNWIQKSSTAKGKESPPYPCINIRSIDLAEVRKALERLCVVSDKHEANTWFNAKKCKERPNVIALQNCLLDVEKLEQLPHSSEFFNTSVLPFTYDPDAECPLWLAAMDDWFKGEPQTIEELQKAFATTLISAQNFKQLFCCYGVTNSGKTTAINILGNMLGEGYTIAAGNSSLTDSFGFSGVDKAKLLVLEEFGIERLSTKEVEILKQLTGGGALRINEKNEKPRYAKSTARIFITTNTEPWKFKDHAQALAKRFIFFVFQSIEGKLDKSFEKKLEAELPGIFNWVLRGVSKLLQGDRVLQPEGRGVDLLAKFTDAGLPNIERFVAKNLVFDKEANHCSTSELFVHYKMVCKERNEDPNPDNLIEFSRRISNLIIGTRCLAEVEPHRERRGGSRGFKYLRFKNDIEDLLEEYELE